MQVKTYNGKSPAHCLIRVKAELGPDAVILSNKTVTKNGKRITEVMAAVEDSSVTTEPAGALGRPTAMDRHGDPMSKDAFLSGALDAASPLSREWEQIKDCLLQFMRSQRDPQRLAPTQRVAMEYLEREGVDEKVLSSIYAELAADPTRSVLPILEALATAKPLEKDAWNTKLHAFAGPGGAGKTSALVRWALREKKQRPDARILLASADGGRGQGRMILRHYAELASLAFREVATKEDFAMLVAESLDFDLILIDLPGMAREEDLTDYLSQMGMHQTAELAVHLVLSPHFGPKQYDAFMAKYRCDKLASIIWTKLDEACTFGPMLNLACATGLPFSALSYGSGLRNSMAPADKEMVWRLLFKHQLPGVRARQGAN